MRREGRRRVRRGKREKNGKEEKDLVRECWASSLGSAEGMRDSI